jgi:hypothetical protein
MLEQIVALQTQELAGHFPLATARNLGHGDLRVVVADPPRDPTEELKRPPMPFQERLGAFAREYLAEDGVAVGQRHHEQGHPGHLAPQSDIRLAEVHLGLSRRMRQRQKHLLVPLPPGPHGVFHPRVAALVLMLGLQPLEDPLDRVPLFPMDLLVALENLADDRHELADLRLLPWPLLLILRRLRVRQNPLERIPVELVLPANRPLARLVRQNLTPNLDPFLHVSEHPFYSSLRGTELPVKTNSPSQSATRPCQERSVFRPPAAPRPPLRFLSALYTISATPVKHGAGAC